MDSGSPDFVILRQESADILHSGYLQNFSDGSCEYPSVEHFCQCQILSYLGLPAEAQQILDEKTAAHVRTKAYRIMQHRFGSTMGEDRLKKYIATSRDAFIRHGLWIRAQKDETFRQTLLGTGNAVIVFCDTQDSENGVGMEESSFLNWVRGSNIRPSTMIQWMMNPSTCLDVSIGHNKLGMTLMSIRDSMLAALEPQRLRTMPAQPETTDSTAISGGGRLFTVRALRVSEQIIALCGVFRPLSNWYAHPIVVQDRKYRSVEHYVYLTLLESLKFKDKALEKIRTTSDPSKLWKIWTQLMFKGKIKSRSLNARLEKVEGWYRKAICHKMSQSQLLRSLLLATGNALLVETSCIEDKEWSVGMEEKEIQHLLTKKYIGPDNLLRWMLSVDRIPKSLSEMGKNLTGVVLMEIRQQLQESQTKESMGPPLPMSSSVDQAIPGLLTDHLICFTADSVFHPCYASRIHEEKFYSTVQHYASAKEAEFFGLPNWIISSFLECDSGHDTALILAENMAGRFPSLEDLYNFEHEERAEIVKKGLRVRFEQHQAALRALLDTGDAFLAFSQRFLSSQCEFSVGMREHDLRAWMQHENIDTKHLARLCELPLSKRPPFLGGNRLGFILMELRRQFTLSGVFPQKLPEMNLSPEEILGSDSLKENMDMEEEFDPEMDHESAIWPSPLLFAAKAEENDVLWEKAQKKKFPQRLLPGDMDDLFERKEIEGPIPSLVDRELMEDMQPNTMRHLILCMAEKIKGMFFSTQMQEAHLKRLDAELGRIRETRRELEKKQRLKQLGLDLDAPGWDDNVLPNNSQGVNDRSDSFDTVNDTGAPFFDPYEQSFREEKPIMEEPISTTETKQINSPHQQFKDNVWATNTAKVESDSIWKTMPNQTVQAGKEGSSPFRGQPLPITTDHVKSEVMDTF